MKHYRVNKLSKVGGNVIKRKDILATNDKQALDAASDGVDCPICDIWSDGKKVGSIL